MNTFGTTATAVCNLVSSAQDVEAGIQLVVNGMNKGDQ